MEDHDFNLYILLNVTLSHFQTPNKPSTPTFQPSDVNALLPSYHYSARASCKKFQSQQLRSRITYGYTIVIRAHYSSLSQQKIEENISSFLTGEAVWLEYGPQLIIVLLAFQDQPQAHFSPLLKHLHPPLLD